MAEDLDSHKIAASDALQVILAVDADMNGEPEEEVLVALVERLREVGFEPDPSRLRSITEAISDTGLDQ